MGFPPGIPPNRRKIAESLSERLIESATLAPWVMGGLTLLSLRLLDLERIGVPVILSVQFGEEDVISRPDAAQIQRYG